MVADSRVHLQDALAVLAFLRRIKSARADEFRAACDAKFLLATVFKTPTEQISNDLKERTDYARDVANKTIDERVRAPVYTVVNGVDQVRHALAYRGGNFAECSNIRQRLTPLVDYLASTLARLNAQVGHAEADASAKAASAEDSAKFQYQRALDLTKDIRSQLFVYSQEQLKQLQAQSVLMYVSFVYIQLS